MLSQMTTVFLVQRILFVDIFEGNLAVYDDRTIHRVESIRSCVNGLGDTVTGVDGATHHAP